MKGIEMIAYGPVPSRRLGHSLGINNIPPKSCTYACAYCQVGHTSNMNIQRRAFYGPETIIHEVGTRLQEVAALGETVDYLSFVPDGEPTLDLHLGKEIQLLRTFAKPVAVITNSSLLGLPDVRAELATADWVSLKIDAVDEKTWRRVNHPHPSLQLPEILESMMAFRSMFTGTLVTETMLIDGVNDSEMHARATAEFVSRLNPDRSYLAIPTRPPALDWVRPPDSEALVRCHAVFSEAVDRVEYLMGYEGNTFSAAGNPRENILGVTSVHPMRVEAVTELLKKAGASWTVIEELLRDGLMREADFGGHRYYIRSTAR